VSVPLCLCCYSGPISSRYSAIITLTLLLGATLFAVLRRQHRSIETSGPIITEALALECHALDSDTLADGCSVLPECHPFRTDDLMNAEAHLLERVSSDSGTVLADVVDTTQHISLDITSTWRSESPYGAAGCRQDVTMSSSKSIHPPLQHMSLISGLPSALIRQRSPSPDSAATAPREALRDAPLISTPDLLSAVSSSATVSKEDTPQPVLASWLTMEHPEGPADPEEDEQLSRHSDAAAALAATCSKPASAPASQRAIQPDVSPAPGPPSTLTRARSPPPDWAAIARRDRDREALRAALLRSLPETLSAGTSTSRYRDISTGPASTSIGRRSPSPDWAADARRRAAEAEQKASRDVHQQGAGRSERRRRQINVTGGFEAALAATLSQPDIRPLPLPQRPRPQPVYHVPSRPDPPFSSRSLANEPSLRRTRLQGSPSSPRPSGPPVSHDGPKVSSRAKFTGKGKWERGRSPSALNRDTPHASWGMISEREKTERWALRRKMEGGA
jgi:hypothetical protein